MADWAILDSLTSPHKVTILLDLHVVTTVSGKLLPTGPNVSEVSICCHSENPCKCRRSPPRELYLICTMSQGAVEKAWWHLLALTETGRQVPLQY